MELLIRNADAVTGSVLMEPLQIIKDFPILMSCTSAPPEYDVVADLIWEISKESGLIQLQKLIPLGVLYSNQHSGTVGLLWAEHHTEFSKFLAKYNPKSVLEIGGGHGMLATEYSRHATASWTIVEPSPTPVIDCPARFIKSLFNSDFNYSEEFDTIVHSHVFEHIYQPNAFIEQLSGLLVNGSHHIFTLPNLQVMLDRNYSNCLNFEHTIFLTEPYIEYLLAKHGFRVIEKQYFKDDHSIFYATVKDSTVLPITLSQALYAKNKQTFTNSFEKQTALITFLNTALLPAPGEVYLFGAHIFSQQLIQSGLVVDNITGILDNDPKKQDLRLYGTTMKIFSPDVLNGKISPTVILNCAAYNNEIKVALSEINPNTIFLEQP